MRNWILVPLIAVCFAGAAAADVYRHVWIEDDNAPALSEQLEAMGFDVLEGGTSPTSIELIVSPEYFDLLHDMGYFPIVLAESRPFSEIQAERQAQFQGEAVPPGYMNLAQLQNEMSTIAANYPDLCEYVNITQRFGGVQTREGRDIYGVKISDNVTQDENEPAYLIVSCHHAREIVTPVIAMTAIERFTSQYATNPTVRSLVDKYEIWVVPVWNVDGYVYMYDVNNFWRKNRMPYPPGVGVDLNRNYPLGWNGPCAGSTNPTSDTYKGPSAASEAETQTLLAISADRMFAKVIDFHSSGREALFAYRCLAHPHQSFWQSEAVALASACGYGGSIRTPSADGEHFQTQLAWYGSHGFLVETSYTFQPSYAEAESEANMCWNGIVHQLQRPIPLTGTVTNSVTGAPVEANIRLVGVSFSNGEQHQSNPRIGHYHVFVPAGSYNVEFSASGYQTQQIQVSVTSNTETVRDIALVPDSLPGDMNCDGFVDNEDIDPFVLAVTGGQAAYQAAWPNCNYMNGDVNGDGFVDNEDIDPFVALITTP